MAEAGCCESCFHYKRRESECDFLYKVCDIHRDPKVLKTIENAEELGAPDVRGFFYCDPKKTVCRRYAPDLLSIGIGKLFKRKKADEDS